MLAQSYGTVGDIEIMWCLIAAVGLGFSLFNLVEAHKDWHALRNAGVRNGRRVIACTTLWVESIRVSIQAVFLLIGIVAMWLPQPDTSAQPTKYTVAGAIIQWGIIFASIAVTAQAVLNTRMREQLANQAARTKETG